MRHWTSLPCLLVGFSFVFCTGVDARRLSYEERREVAELQETLRKHFCNRPAVWRLLGFLSAKLDYAEGADIALRYIEKCDKDADIAWNAARYLFWLTRFDDALKLIDRFPEPLQRSPYWAAQRGYTLEKLRRHEEAAVEFEKAVMLFNDIKRVAGSQFYMITRAYEAAGKPCRAMHAMEWFVSFDPKTRMTAEVEGILRRLERGGNCNSKHKRRGVRVRLDRRNGLALVSAKVNGVAGTFILDTGASTVHLTRRFARRARLKIDTANRVRVRGVVGERNDYLVVARTVSIEQAGARDVRATVASRDGVFDRDVDGLLGQTFLSRFKVQISGSYLVLEPWR